MIPPRIHQIWLGPDPLPDDFAAYVETWKRQHPSWEHTLWAEANLPEGLRPEVYERLRGPAERSDILRLELLRRFGGVYVDTDFECLRPLDPLLDGVELFAAYHKDPETVAENRVNNAILGAAAGHPTIVRALAEIRPRSTWGLVDKEGTGPLFVDRMLREGGATIFEQRLFYPRWSERDDAVAYHHMARTWKDEPGLRRSARLARSRTRRAEAELELLDRRRSQLERRVLAVEQRLRVREEGGSGAGVAGRLAGELGLRLEWIAFRNRRRARYFGGRGVDAARRRLRDAAARASSPAARLGVRSRAAVEGGPAANGELLVPRVFHHVRLGEEPAGPEAEARLETWRLAHPDWEVRVWSDEELPPGLGRPEIHDLLRSPAERGDLLRLELLARFGGVAIGAGFACRRPVEPLVAGRECFAAEGPDGGPLTVFLGAVPGHPAIARALAEARPVEWNEYSDERTGSGALARALAAGAAIELLPRAAFFPRTLAERTRAYGRLEGEVGGEDREQLAGEVRETELRQREAELAVEQRRGEVEALEQRLAELRGRLSEPRPSSR